MKKTIAMLAAPALFVIACGGNDKPPPQTAAQQGTNTAPAVTTTQATTLPTNQHMAVNVDDAITKACNLQAPNVEAQPKFDFDSDQVSPEERQVLDQIARCLTTGPLKGRSVELVGRADPRGETEYNMTLGAKRARSVHTYLANLGVGGEKMRDTSRGELDATGKDENGWKLDRRVDVKLIP